MIWGTIVFIVYIAVIVGMGVAVAVEIHDDAEE